MINTLKKIVLLLFFIFLVLAPKEVHSQKNDSNKFFDTSTETTYRVLENAKTIVSQKIVIINKEDYTYAPSYSITLHLDNISDIEVSNSEGPIPYTVSEENSAKIINIDFPERIIGKDKKNEFSLSYLSSDYASKTGSIFRVNIPAVSNLNNFTSYTTYVAVPMEVGKPILFKPKVSYTENNGVYTFPSSSLSSGVVMFFGNSQYYDFELFYNLENKNLHPIETEITIPADTSYQEVILKGINPTPAYSYIDGDGNVLLRYRLEPKSSYNVKASVLVRISDYPIEEELTAFSRKEYLKPQKYWEVNDPEIKKLAMELKTAENIYNYVVKSLSYDEGKTGDENERLGGKGALKKPYFAVCLEFTDLFIALARAAGIPSRAVEGFAYTRDDKDKPLSLYQDVLHAWPEYYNEDKKAWIYVDPTWGNTTKGTDFFHQLDFDHVAFTINGLDSTYPVPAGGYKGKENSKDIVFQFANPSDFKKIKNLKIKSAFSSFAKNNKISGTIGIENKGNYTAYDYKASVVLDGNEKINITFPPTSAYGKSEVSVFLPSSLTKILHNIKIFDEEGKLVFEKNILVFPFSEYLLIGGALSFGAFIVLIIAFKTRRIPVQR